MRLPRPTVVAGVAAGLVLASVGVSSLVSRGAAAAAPGTTGAVVSTTHPITSADLVCPVPATAKGVSQAVITAGALGHQTGTLSLYKLAGSLTAPPLAEALAGSATLRYTVPVGKAAPLLLRATGSYAPGLTASVTTRVGAGTGRSLQRTSCTAAGPDAWFVGGGASIGRRSVLSLTNIDAAPATVDVTLYTAAGIQLPTPVQGVTISPRSQLTFALDLLAPGVPATAVHVLTRSGRVASALSDTQVNGLVALGADWVPAAQPPGLSAVVVGVPGDADAKRTLSLVVPGQDDAVVNVRLLTADGTLSPDDLQGLSVPSGKLTSLPVAAPAGSGPFSVVVESDRPLVAGVRTVRSAAGAGAFADFSYAAGSSPFAKTVLLPGIAHTAVLSTSLQLAAPGDADVVVAVTTTTGAAPATAKTPAVAASPPKTQRLTVTAGTSVQLVIGPVGAALSSVVVVTAAGAGPLYVGWVTSEVAPRGPMFAGGSALQTPLTLSMPAVAADPAVGYPGH